MTTLVFIVIICFFIFFGLFSYCEPVKSNKTNNGKSDLVSINGTSEGKDGKYDETTSVADGTKTKRQVAKDGHNDDDDDYVKSGVCGNRVLTTPIKMITPDGKREVYCRCNWPTLYRQTDIYSPCNLRIERKSRLVHKVSGKALEETDVSEFNNIHDYQYLDCGPCSTRGNDTVTGLPSCVPLPVGARSGNLCLYGNTNYDNTEGTNDYARHQLKTMVGEYSTSDVLPLESKFIDRKFRLSFDNVNRDKVVLLNPCAIDSLDGATSMKNLCVLRLSKSGIAYCDPIAYNVSTMIYEDDYLAGNNGRYANACYKFTESNDNVVDFITEYYNRKRPDSRRKKRRTGIIYPKVQIGGKSYEDYTPSAPNRDNIYPTVHNAEPSQTSGNGNAGRSPQMATPPVKGRQNQTNEQIPPVVNLRVKYSDILLNVRVKLKIPNVTSPNELIIFTQAPVPSDVESISFPMDRWSLLNFIYEYNDFTKVLVGKTIFNLHCNAPVQRVYIPQCNDITSNIDLTDCEILSSIIQPDSERASYESIVSCRNSIHDPRVAIVPNLDMGPYNSLNSTAILRFDLKTFMVHHYWADIDYRKPGTSIESALVETRDDIAQYVASLPNRPI